MPRIANQLQQRLLPELAEGLAGTYDLLSVLGQGGNGMVLEVRNLSLERLEALKILLTPMDPEAAVRFEREAKLAASLEHPAIVPIYAFGRVGGRHWFTMKLVEGPSLSKLIAVHRRLDEALAIRILLPILDALAMSHGRGIVHRDIKPENILVDVHGHPLLADFGIAKQEQSHNLTMSGMVLGTPAYLAPEQIRGVPLDGRTDLYALGVTLFQMLTGELPFGGGSSMQNLLKRVREDPPDPRSFNPGISGELAGITLAALARERDARFPDAKSMAKALRTAAALLDCDLSAPIGVPAELRLKRKPLEIDLPTSTRAPGSAADPVPPPVAAPPSRNPETHALDFGKPSRGSLDPTAQERADTATAGPTRFAPPTAPAADPAPADPAPSIPAAPRSGARPKLVPWIAAAVPALALLGSLPWLMPRLRPVAAPPPAERPAGKPAVQDTAPLPEPKPAQPPPASDLKPLAKPARQIPSPSAEKAAPSAEFFVRRPVVPPTPNGSVLVEASEACKGTTVVVSISVGEDGSAREVVVLNRAKVPVPCAEAALRAAKRMTFVPAKDYQGQPVAGTASIPIAF